MNVISMGDKNNISRIIGSDVQVKIGHGIVKSIYVTVPGDRIYEIIDGTDNCDTTVINMDLTAVTEAPILMPYINHPMGSGIRVDVISGATGEILVVFE